MIEKYIAFKFYTEVIGTIVGIIILLISIAYLIYIKRK